MPLCKLILLLWKYSWLFAKSINRIIRAWHWASSPTVINKTFLERDNQEFRWHQRVETDYAIVINRQQNRGNKPNNPQVHLISDHVKYDLNILRKRCWRPVWFHSKQNSKWSSLVFLHNEVFVMVVRLRSGEVTASQGSLLSFCYWNFYNVVMQIYKVM